MIRIPASVSVKRCLAAALVALALAACKIEQTPQSYVDRQVTPEEERERSRDTLQQRLSVLTSAIREGDTESVIRLLNPREDAYVMAPGSVADAEGRRPVSELIIRTGSEARVTGDSIVVTIGPRNNYAWFRMDLHDSVDAEASPALRFSGVLMRYEGEWQLVQGHLAVPRESLNPSLPESPTAEAPTLEP